MKNVIAIFGPTASGKSSLALSIAKKLNGVIVSADSMQIYKEMDIGTAKPTREEMQEVPHRMIDICSPTANFSVYDYKLCAEKEIDAILFENRVPLLVGGTGLYFDALFFNNNFGEMDVDPEIHDILNQRAAAGEGEILLSELLTVDPDTAIHLNAKDLKRIVRALEVYLSTGKTLSEFKAESRIESSKYNFIKLFLNYKSREKLYERINLRVDLMLEEGLLKETENLREKGYFSSKTASQAIGYKELLPFFSGEKDLASCVELLKQKSRNYAKRQLTWFRRYEDAHTIWMDETTEPVEEAIAYCKKYS